MLSKIKRKAYFLKSALSLKAFDGNERVMICPSLKKNLVLEALSTRLLDLRRFRSQPEGTFLRSYLNHAIDTFYDQKTNRFHADRFTLDLPKFKNARGVLLNDYREQFFDNVYFKYLPFGAGLEESVILDCGSNIGAFAIYAATRSEKVRVECFEPHPEIRKYLQNNIALNGLESRIHVHERCLSDKPGDLLLEFNDDCFTMTKTGTKGNLRVGATTIDRFVQDKGLNKVDLIKMDIEGAERHALVGAAETIRKFRPRMAISAYHIPDDVYTLTKAVLDIVPDYFILVTREKHLYAFPEPVHHAH